jgi:hypothetical protein
VEGRDSRDPCDCLGRPYSYAAWDLCLAPPCSRRCQPCRRPRRVRVAAFPRGLPAVHPVTWTAHAGLAAMGVPSFLAARRQTRTKKSTTDSKPSLLRCFWLQIDWQTLIAIRMKSQFSLFGPYGSAHVAKTRDCRLCKINRAYRNTATRSKRCYLEKNTFFTVSRVMPSSGPTAIAQAYDTM